MSDALTRAWLLAIPCLLAGCHAGSGSYAGRYAGISTDAPEQPVTIVPLAGDITDRSAELSGLAWYGDQLILLPQYPARFADRNEGSVFAIPKERILAFLDGAADAPIEPSRIDFDDQGLAKRIRGFEGFEAIAFDGDRVYLTVEARRFTTMVGYLVAGRIEPHGKVLRLEPDSAVELSSQSHVENMSDEVVLLTPDGVITLHEANGARVNAHPVGYVFDPSLRPSKVVPFPNVEYRITDATGLDEQRRFWAIDFFYPGDSWKLKPGPDAIAARHGVGPTHARSRVVERLLEFQVTAQGIALTDAPPIQLRLDPAGPRNWEGIVRLDDRGFLLATDKYPGTLLAFVPCP